MTNQLERRYRTVRHDDPTQRSVPLSLDPVLSVLGYGCEQADPVRVAVLLAQSALHLCPRGRGTQDLSGRDLEHVVAELAVRPAMERDRRDIENALRNPRSARHFSCELERPLRVVDSQVGHGRPSSP
jgi:hypothetical protein